MADDSQKKPVLPVPDTTTPATTPTIPTDGTLLVAPHELNTDSQLPPVTEPATLSPIPLPVPEPQPVVSPPIVPELAPAISPVVPESSLPPLPQIPTASPTASEAIFGATPTEAVPSVPVEPAGRPQVPPAPIVAEPIFTPAPAGAVAEVSYIPPIPVIAEAPVAVPPVAPEPVQVETAPTEVTPAPVAPPAGIVEQPPVLAGSEGSLPTKEVGAEEVLLDEVNAAGEAVAVAAKTNNEELSVDKLIPSLEKIIKGSSAYPSTHQTTVASPEQPTAADEPVMGADPLRDAEAQIVDTSVKDSAADDSAKVPQSSTEN